MQKDIQRIHEGLKHPEKETIHRLLRQLNDGERIPNPVNESIDSLRCITCAAIPELPRKPKLALPAEATPNITVSLDFMSNMINNRQKEVLVMLDHGDMLLKLKHIPDHSVETSFNAFYSRWISIFDSPALVLVERGSNLNAQLMRDQLHKVQSQLLPIPTEAPWSLGINERSHRYIHNSIDRLLLQRDYSVGYHLEVLLADVEVGWNFTQQSNNVLPHYHRFGIMPKIIGKLGESSRLNERIALMELARRETDQLRALDFVLLSLDPIRLNVHSLRSFTVNDKVWLYRKRHEWHVGIIATIEKPTVTVSYEGKLFPTH